LITGGKQSINSQWINIGRSGLFFNKAAQYSGFYSRKREFQSDLLFAYCLGTDKLPDFAVWGQVFDFGVEKRPIQVHLTLPFNVVSAIFDNPKIDLPWRY
jgi:hypothetical protein